MGQKREIDGWKREGVVLRIKQAICGSEASQRNGCSGLDLISQVDRDTHPHTPSKGLTTFEHRKGVQQVERER